MDVKAGSGAFMAAARATRASSRRRSSRSPSGAGLRDRRAAHRHGPGARPHRRQRGRGARVDRLPHRRARASRACTRSRSRCAAALLVQARPRRRRGPRARRPSRRSTPAPPPSASRAMVAALGGPADLLERPGATSPPRRVTRAVAPERAGVRRPASTARAVGLVVTDLGGGRRREDDAIDHAVGLTDVAGARRARSARDRPLAVVHARDDGERRRGRRARCAPPFAVGDRAPADRTRRSLEALRVSVAARPSCTSTSRAPRRPRSSAGSPQRNGLDGARGRVRRRRTASRGATSSTSCAPTTSRRASSAPAEDYRDITYEYLASCARRGRDLRRADRLARPRRAGRARPTPSTIGGHRRRASTTPARDTGIEARILIDRGAQLRRRARPRRVAAPRRRAAAPVRRRLQPGRRRGGLPARAVRASLRDRRATPASAAPSTPASGPGAESRSAAALALPRHPHRPRRARDRGPGARRGARRARDRARGLPDVERRRSASSRATRTHPLRALRDAGVPRHARLRRPALLRRVAIGGEYAVARERFGFDEGELREITRTAVEAAFVGRCGQDALFARSCRSASDRAAH